MSARQIRGQAAQHRRVHSAWLSRTLASQISAPRCSRALFLCATLPIANSQSWFSIAPLSLWLIEVTLRCVIRPFFLYRVKVVDARAINQNGNRVVGALVSVSTAHFVAGDLEGEGDGQRDGRALEFEMTRLKSVMAEAASGRSSAVGSLVSQLTLDVSGFPRDFQPGSYCFLNIPACSVSRRTDISSGAEKRNDSLHMTARV